MLERGSHFWGHISVQPFVSICKCGDTIYLFLNWKNPHLMDRIPEWEWTWVFLSDAWRCSSTPLQVTGRSLLRRSLPSLEEANKSPPTSLGSTSQSQGDRFFPNDTLLSSYPQVSHPATCAGISKSLCPRLWASILAGPNRLSSITGLLDPVVLLLSSKILLAALVAWSHSWLTEAFYTWSCVSQHPPPLVPLILGVPSRPYMYPHSVGPDQDLFESPSPSSLNEMQNHC